MSTPPLLLCLPAPVIDKGDELQLDVKFVEGMRLHREIWGGDVRCVMWRGAQSIPFGNSYAREDLDFELIILDEGAPVPHSAFDGMGVLLLSADMPGGMAIRTAAASRRVPVVVGIEYTYEARRQILDLDDQIGFFRRLRRKIWLNRNESQVRSLLRAAQGVQFNGYPALDTYGAMCRNTHLYLDNRMAPDLMATKAEMETRATRLTSGAPLRLIHSGRLERMKGAQDLLPVMRALKRKGVDATLDIYGTGAIEETIRSELPEFDGAVRLHAPVDFARELVPISRTQADVFLSCHRQSDPSCTYLEAMGCGLALVGYGNAMWSRLNAEAQTGAVAPVGDINALAARVAKWDQDREALTRSAQAGLEFARRHDFQAEFEGRMTHLRSVLR